MRGCIVGAAVFAAAAIAVSANAAKGEEGTMERTVRPPVVAGQFYPGDPVRLRRDIEGYLDAVGAADVGGRVVALVSPHAGYQYSGAVAAHGYRLIRGRSYETVVVISPCHVEYFDFSSVFPGAAYETPLGAIPVNREIVELLAGTGGRVRAAMEGHRVVAGGRGEHSLEVQLPFLQVALGQFDLVAIVMGDQSASNVRILGEALGEALAGRNALIVASTDLSHFHAGREAGRLDGVFLDGLRGFSVEQLLSSLSSGGTEACGGGPTAAAMIAAGRLGASRCDVLAYATSGDVTGDHSSVVGYVSAAMIAAGSTGDEEPQGTKRSSSRGAPGDDAGLDDGTRRFLLRLARRTIARALGDDAPLPERPASNVLGEKRGGFVTLKKGGRLRGCIGYIEAVKPLADTISEMAVAAAFDDYRFPPVTADEIDGIEIEISVLSPVVRIADPGRVEVGRHGIIITRGSHRGLLLPQVAVEWNWDRERFLDQTCVKAGLEPGAWRKEGTVIEVFSADVFSERGLGLR
ncbi:MAG: AmmeMemoRadiSam system protein B [Candidatus Krumholzibacteriota bacterium]|nr:AmmeMemoRadiSam system protein B [Candidatus Krumholzibacteriota bacterium]